MTASHATNFILENHENLSIDPARLAVGGDSAGGNLAAVAAIALKGKIAFQLLIYPATDQRMASESLKRNGEGYLLTRALMEKFRGNYLPRARGPSRLARFAGAREEPRRPAAGLRADRGFDPLQDEGREYAERLKREGVAVEYRDYPDMIHGFIVMGGVLDAANEAVADCCAALRRAFEKVIA